MREDRNVPGRGARTVAGMLGFGMTLLLFLAAALAPVNGVLLSRDTLERAAVAPETLAAEEGRIREKLAPLAASVQADPERLAAAVDRDTLTEFNGKAAGRLAVFLETGKLGETPVLLLPGVHQVLMEESVYASASDPDEIEEDMLRTAEKITDTVAGIALQLREPLLRIAEKTLREETDYPALIGAARKLPLLLLALALAFSGGIALAVSRRLALSLRYIGAAAAAAGLLVLFSLLLFRSLGLEALLAEASPMMHAESRLLAGMIRNRLLICAAALIPVGTAAFLSGSGRMRKGGVP